MSDVRCTYKRVKGDSQVNRHSGYYLTSCGFRISAISFGWKYCPFCGKPFLKKI